MDAKNHQKFRDIAAGRLPEPVADKERIEFWEWCDENHITPSPKPRSSEKEEHINDLADRLQKRPTKPESPVLFPVSALDGTIFEIFIKAFEGRSEVCPAYHFASLLNAFSGIAGHRILFSLDGDFTTKTNFFQCLLGIPSWSRKSSAQENSIMMMDAVLEEPNILDALNTREGFIDAIDEEYPQVTIILDELNSLLTKSKTRAGAGLIDMLNTAFNSKRLSNNSITNQRVIENPTVTFFGAITPDLLEISLDNEGLGGGFMSRCVFYDWERQPRVRSWGGYDKDLIQLILRVLSNAAALTEEVVYSFSDRALVRSTEWYENFAIDDTDENMNAVGRVPYYADKLAAVLSFSENSQSNLEISLETWNRVEKIAEYWSEVYRKHVTPSVFMNSDMKKENRVKDFLSKFSEGATKTDFNKLRSVSTQDRNKILSALLESGEVIFLEKERRYQLLN